MLKSYNRVPSTLELREIIESDNLILFDFDYSFYDDLLKSQFEQKFSDYFYFRNIGMETIGRFKKELKTKLNIIAPYYKQLYETELECKNISFMLNKDLVETFTRDVTGEHIGNVNSIDESKNTSLSNKNLTDNFTKNSNTQNNANTISIDENKNTTENTNNNKFYDTPRNKIEDLEKFVTNVTKDNNNSIVDGLTKNNTENTNTSINTENTNTSLNDTTNNTIDGVSKTNANTLNSSKNTETTELISRGNIGVTSSATLLSMWRDILINIDLLILDECEELFLSIF